MLVCSKMFMRLDEAASGGIPRPPAGYVPPMGSSRNTWTNIYKNKGRIDYCVQQFQVEPRSRTTRLAATQGHEECPHLCLLCLV